MTSKIVITITDTGEGFLINQRSVMDKTSTPEEAKQANLMMYWMTQLLQTFGGDITKMEEEMEERPKDE